MTKFKYQGESYSNECIKRLKDGDTTALEDLFYNVGSLASTLYIKHTYHYQNSDEVLSLIWENLEKIALKYKPGISAFGTYLYKNMRSQMQKDFNYNGALVHTPVLLDKVTITNSELILNSVEDEEEELSESQEKFSIYLELYKKLDLSISAKNNIKTWELYNEHMSLRIVSNILNISHQVVDQRIKKFEKDFTKFCKQKELVGKQ